MTSKSWIWRSGIPHKSATVIGEEDDTHWRLWSEICTIWYKGRASRTMSVMALQGEKVVRWCCHDESEPAHHLMDDLTWVVWTHDAPRTHPERYRDFNISLLKWVSGHLESCHLLCCELELPCECRLTNAANDWIDIQTTKTKVWKWYSWTCITFHVPT